MNAKEEMQKIAAALDKILGGKGFALLVFDFDKIGKSHINYVSNAEREDMIVVIKELSAQWEGRVVTTDKIQ